MLKMFYLEFIFDFTFNFLLRFLINCELNMVMYVISGHQKKLYNTCKTFFKI